MDRDEAVGQFRGAMQQIASLADREREQKRAEAMAGPVASPNDVLVFDPDTKQRRKFYTATPLHFQKIGFKVLRRAELKYVPAAERDNACWDWPVAAKVRVLRSCLVEPALPFPEQDDDDALEQWADEHLAWQALDDLVAGIYMESRHIPKVPDYRTESGPDKGPPVPQDASDSIVDDWLHSKGYSYRGDRNADDLTLIEVGDLLDAERAKRMQADGVSSSTTKAFELWNEQQAAKDGPH
jgi:hypothetical protein